MCLRGREIESMYVCKSVCMFVCVRERNNSFWLLEREREREKDREK